MTVYTNTPENAKNVGWDRLPEYCVGDRSAPFVIHDEVKGIFTFQMADPEDPTGYPGPHIRAEDGKPLSVSARDRTIARLVADARKLGM